MSLPREQAWFRAKRYGYGWGLPLRWQGWLVMLGYIAAILAVGFGVARDHLVAFVVCSILFSAMLVGICYWKGEAPKWRWGEVSDDGHKNA